MTDEELKSNISMTNKDFNTIYPELLDLVKKLTDRWDPSLSNESDPGLILLKLNALIADKCNYNIDKNILEAFPLSVTQIGNARELYDSLGYRMHWYRSATADIGFIPTSLTNLTDNEGNATTQITIPAFTTIINDNGNIIFTTLRDLPLINTEDIKYVECIQGSYYDYQINGSNVITINDLDANLRLYFTETKIAENGVFIIDAGSNQSYADSPWKLVDNIESSSDRKVYELGITPNSNTYYIQFPQDIGDLIGDGLNIRYIISSGIEGNIKAYTLNTFNSTFTNSDKVKIIQNTAVVNGKQPETIDEAYYNYKKQVGTFNTLVTRRDYNNYIYNLYDNIYPVVSNIVVSDRTNDITDSDYIQTWDIGIEKKELIVHPVSNNSTTPAMTAYDVKLYMLKAQKNITTADTYNASFAPDLSLTTELIVKDDIDEIKAVQHDIALPRTGDYFIFNNLYVIKGTLYTYYKVSKAEAKDIEKNVTLALMSHYNGREIEFGTAIDYEELNEVIISADSRIKGFINTENSINTVKTKTSESNFKESLADSDKEKMVARMATSGNVQLFLFDDAFGYDFGQTDNAKIESNNHEYKIKSITSATSITIPANSTQSSALQKNELLRVYTPTLITKTEYSVGVKVTNLSSSAIPANTAYKLQNPLVLTYVDSNNITQSVTIPANEYIFSSVQIAGNANQQVLLSGQYLRHQQINQVEIASGTQCYCLLNNSSNTLNIAANSYYVLRENEYFLYTNSLTNELIRYGSGTLLKNTSSSAISIQFTKIDIDITEIEDLDWKKLPQTLKAVDLTIYSIDEGGTASQTGSSALTATNTLTELANNIQITLTDKFGETQIIPANISSDFKNLYESRLMINSSLNNPQQLLSNQTMSFTMIDNTSAGAALGEGNYIIFSSAVVLAGGIDIDVAVIGSDGTLSYSLEGYKYKISSGYDLTRDDNGYIKLTKNMIGQGKNLPFNFSQTAEYYEYLIPIKVIATNCTISVKAYKAGQPDAAIPLYNTSSSANSLTSGNYTLQIAAPSGGYDGIKINISGTGTYEADVYIGKIHKHNGLNTGEINSEGFNLEGASGQSTTIAKIIDDMKNIIGDHLNFNWVYTVPSDRKVIYPTSAESFWDRNHIYNYYTVPQIDFNSSSIKVSNTNIE